MEVERVSLSKSITHHSQSLMILLIILFAMKFYPLIRLERCEAMSALATTLEMNL